MDLSHSDWRYRLKGDPGNWLLDETDNPSVFFWFLRDIVGRPEDSPSLVEAREKILYSNLVQAIFERQDPAGFWESAISLDVPRYSSTLWMLALLAELGIPRASRRASLACEFVLQNHVNEDGAFTSLRDTSSGGLLEHALLYFRREDARLRAILGYLEASAKKGDVYALWALAGSNPYKTSTAILQGRERLIDAVVRGEFRVFGAWPPFDTRDLLLGLCVLTALGASKDDRLAPAMETIWQRQEDGARWSNEINYAEHLPVQFEPANAPSKWATLNVLRAVTRSARVNGD